MRPVRTALTTAIAGPVIVLDHYINPSFYALGVKIVGGTATYTVQHTFDDPFASGFDPATAVWYPHVSLAAVSANADGNYQEAPMACRLNVSAIGGGATVTLTVIPAGI